MRLKRLAAIAMTGITLLAALPLSAMAISSGTITKDTAYTDLSPNTEIYAVSGTAGTDYPYYGAKYEPQGGVYYGRIAEGGVVTNGWGVVNMDEVAAESAVSFYYTLGNEYALEDEANEYWSYMFNDVISDNQHILEINLNFSNEKADCTAVLNGDFDSQLKTDFKYLATLSCPVFLRIGAEPNVWSNAASTSTYISAYRHIGDLAHQYCSNVALVYSPNYTSSYNVDMDAFYPGDSYVDWVGVSLYYNEYAANGDTSNDAFYGVGTYGNPITNMQQVVTLASRHSKPIMVTEGGSQKTFSGGTDCTSFAADRIAKAYSYLTMVYPQIKCIIYSDSAFGKDASNDSYRIYDSTTLTDAYNTAVAGNPTLIQDYNSTSGLYYTKLSAFDMPEDGTVKLAAYTYSSEKLSATWYVNGEQVATCTEYPYSCSVDISKITTTTYTIGVEFSNGDGKVYTFHKQYKGPFTDVDTEGYYIDAVSWAYNSGITTGTTETTFSPDNECTRAQIVTMLWRNAGEPEASASVPFTDVNKNAYYADAVAWAYEQGITTGTSATTFDPDAICTRAQIVTFQWRAAGQPAGTAENGFTDVPDSAYYAGAVRWALEKEITTGTSDTTFSPEKSCTRAEAVTFLYRESKS